MLITLEGRIPSKKNSKIMVCRGSRPLLLSSEKYDAWHYYATEQLLLQKLKRGIKKCTIIMTFFAPDNRKSDLTNKAESVMDLLVDNGILEDDNWFVCHQLTLRLGGVDKAKPRVEIEII